MASLEQNIKQAIADFNSIEAAIKEKGIDVPAGTDTSKYGELISEIGADEYDRGYEVGYTDGYDDGETEGYADGHESGYAEGQDAGYSTGIQQGYAQGHNDGKAEGYEEGYNDAKAEEETFFTDYGVMYKRNMVIPTRDIIVANGYQYARELETVSAPYCDVGSALTGSVFRNCEKLKTVSLPRMRKIGNTYFGGCLALEEVTLGCEEVPLQQLNENAFQYCSALVRLNLIGRIANSMNFQWCPLSVESMIAIIMSLVPHEFPTYTLRFSEECWAALENSGEESPNLEPWRYYVEYYLGWLT